MKWRVAWGAVISLLWATSAFAVIETYEFDSPELAVRYQALSAELRCPKCQNQNIADSNAAISQDLRRQLYLQLQAGASNAEIKTFMVERYGEFVLYRPRFSSATAVLWLAPLILLLMAAVVVAISLRKKSAAGPAKAAGEDLDPAEQQRLSELLNTGEVDD